MFSESREREKYTKIFKYQRTLLMLIYICQDQISASATLLLLMKSFNLGLLLFFSTTRRWKLLKIDETTFELQDGKNKK